MRHLLAALTQPKDPGGISWKAYFYKIFGCADTNLTEQQKQSAWSSYQAAENLIGIIETVLWIIIGVVGLAAVVYAIYLGFQLARASEQGKRDEAKKHLITVVIAIVVTLVLVIFFLYLLPGILSAFHTTSGNLTTGTQSGG